MMSGGLLAEANKAQQAGASKPGKLALAMMGTSVNSATRLDEVTAKGRRRLLSMSGLFKTTVPMVREMWSVMACSSTDRRP